MLEFNLPLQQAITQNNAQFQHFRKIRKEIIKINNLDRIDPLSDYLLSEFAKAIKDSDLHEVRRIACEIEKLWTKERYR
jgi:hypothetical protein